MPLPQEFLGGVFINNKIAISRGGTLCAFLDEKKSLWIGPIPPSREMQIGEIHIRFPDPYTDLGSNSEDLNALTPPPRLSSKEREATGIEAKKL